jgi:hypothetical protein
MKYQISYIMLCVVSPISAKDCCKSFQSLVIKCALTAAQLNVTGNLSVAGNATVGGNLSVSGNISSGGTVTATGNITSSGGTISDTNGSIGNLTSFANFFGQGQAAANTNSAGIPLTFPTKTQGTSSITNNASNNTFTITTPGIYQVSYQVNGTYTQPTTLSLTRSTNSGPFLAVPGGQVSSTDIANMITSGNTTFVNAAQGDQFQILGISTAAGTITFPATTNGTSVTFTRVGS